MSGEHILIVEDDPAIMLGLSEQLNFEDYRLSCVEDGADAKAWLSQAKPDLLILDLMLPGLDGLSLLRWLRKSQSDLPVLIISARASLEDKIIGLDLGADDYLAKPFGLKELMARIDALLRRQRSAYCQLKLGDISIDLSTRRVCRAGEEIVLSKIERDLLMFLARRSNSIHTRDHLLASVWGALSVSDPRSVDFHILNLRKKIETDPKVPQLILTHHRQGYEFRA